MEEMAEILQVTLKNFLAGKKEVGIENNPVIKNLNECVTRLEQILRKYIR